MCPDLDTCINKSFIIKCVMDTPAKMQTKSCNPFNNNYLLLQLRVLYVVQYKYNREACNCPSTYEKKRNIYQDLTSKPSASKLLL